MTARRRRKSGSGPSATAVIAWVGGTGFEADHDSGAAGSAHAPSSHTDGRPVLVGRARGLAAGTLLACGSVLAIAVHAADSSGPQQDGSPGLVTVGPGAASGGYAAAPVASSSTSPPAVTKAQALGGPDVRSGAVPRNVPQSVGVSSGPSAQPLRQGPVTMPGADQGQGAPQRDPVERALEPVTQAPKTVVGAIGEMFVPNGRGLAQTGSLTARVIPAAQASAEVLRTAPVGDVLTAAQQPVGEVLAPLDEVVAPVQEGAHPAMAMLSPLSLG